MVGIIIASHGTFASGILQSAQMILGEQENIKACTLMPSMGPEDIRKQMEDAVQSFDDPEQVLFLVDLWGGTPFNQASGFLAGHEDTWAIVAGLNLPMLIEACGDRYAMDTAHEIATAVIEEAQGGVRIKPESLQPAAPVQAASGAAPAQMSGAIPEGTVLGDGHIKYVLARIDTRLLHGQVATAWTKAVQPDRIIVVSDGVANDDLRKQMIMEAAPPGVRANVVPISKIIQVEKDPRFGDTKAMLLFETPQDALQAIEGGVQIKEINLGSMAHTQGKVVLTKTVSMGKKDVETFDKLLAHGIKIDVRKVPADAAENFDEILKRAKTELA